MAEQSSSTAPELLNLDEREGEVETTENGPKQIRPVIGINFCESTPLVWRAAEVKAARERGIIGSLVGSLARQPRQNCRLGRPLELAEEEGRLLVEMGEAVRIPPIDPQVKLLPEDNFHEFNSLDLSPVRLPYIAQRYFKMTNSTDLPCDHSFAVCGRYFLLG